MFEEYYKYSLKNILKNKSSQNLIEQRIYTCKSVYKDTYFINVERYQNEIYLIKFHLKCHKLSRKKYQLLIRKGKANRIISTCIQIILDLFKENNEASFLIQGMHQPDENLVNTKRYRIYKQLITRLISDEFFHHVLIDKKSVYILINKKHESKELYFDRIKEMFEKEYKDVIL